LQFCCENSRFVSGHRFSDAVSPELVVGFSRCGPTWARK